MHPVDSSAMARLGYDEEAEEALVEFHDAGLYAYEGVPPAVYAEFDTAESKGTFLNEVIKLRYPARTLQRGHPSFGSG
ncbi:MAG TPA: KTSC domain-containing protein [Solirubrobacterales bacterium]|nr:KTSC domain-containing protein [Solirubrobacterales bacterium]